MNNEKAPREDQSRGAKVVPTKNYNEYITATPRFTWERALRASPDVRGPQMLLLLVIATHMVNLTGKGYVSLGTLAKELSVNERTVRRQRDEMIARGWLACLERGHSAGKASVYALTIPSDYGHPDVHSSVDTQTSDYGHSEQDYGHSGHDCGHPDVHSSMDTQMSTLSPRSQSEALRPKGSDLGQGTATDNDPEPLPSGRGRGSSDKNAAVRYVVEAMGMTTDEAAAYVDTKIGKSKSPVERPLGYIKKCVAEDQKATDDDGTIIPSSDGDSSYTIEY